MILNASQLLTSNTTAAATSPTRCTQHQDRLQVLTVLDPMIMTVTATRDHDGSLTHGAGGLDYATSTPMPG